MTVWLKDLFTDGCLVCPCVTTPLQVLTAAESGIRCVEVGGYAAGATLAVSEPLVGLEEFALLTRWMARVAPEVAIVVDGGAGYGEALHTFHTVREIEAAGASAIHLEDQFFPKRAHYHKGVEEIIDTEEMVDKIAAAVAARRDPNFTIIGRTDAARMKPFDEAIARANAYVEAGADMILLFPNTIEEARRAAEEIPVALMYVNSVGNKFGRPVLTLDQLNDLGYAIGVDAIGPTIDVYVHQRAYFDTLLKEGRGHIKDVTERRLELESVIKLHDLYGMEERTTYRRTHSEPSS